MVGGREGLGHRCTPVYGGLSACMSVCQLAISRPRDDLFGLVSERLRRFSLSLDKIRMGFDTIRTRAFGATELLSGKGSCQHGLCAIGGLSSE